MPGFFTGIFASPPTPAPPALEIVAAAINADCDSRLPGAIPGIELSVIAQSLGNIVGITDATFEDGSTGSAVPTTAGSPLQPTCVIENTTTEALDGTHSLLLRCTAEGATNGAMGVLLGPYAVITGRVYTITANVRGGTARSVMLSGYYVDDTNTEIGSGAGSDTVTDSSSAWMGPAPFLVLSAAPANAAALYVEVQIESPTGPLAAPSGLTVTPTGATGSTLYAYVVTALNAYGESLSSAVVQITNGNATLSGTNYNALSWTAASGATGYNVYRGSPGDYGALIEEFGDYADIWTTLGTYADILTYVGELDFVAETASTTYHDTNPGPLAPPGPPSENTTGEPAFIDEVGGYASATVDTWSLAPAGYVTIVRSDGTFVQGASPLSPLMLAEDGTAEITDWTAPFGEFVTYVGNLFQLGHDEQPSSPSDPVQMGQAVDTCTLYERLGWAKDEDETGLLEQWLAGIGQMVDRLDSVSRDSYDTDGDIAPSWSTVLDINRCPSDALPWLGQFVGARLPSTLRDDQMRYEIENSPSWARGTPASILAAANRYLLPGYAATLTERNPDPYSLAITVPNAGVVGNATYGSIANGYPTYTAVQADFGTYAALWSGTAAIENAIEGAIPAGLVLALSFV